MRRRGSVPPLNTAGAFAVAALLLAGISIPILLAFDVPGLVALETGDLGGARLPPPPTLRLLSPEEGQGVSNAVRIRGEAESQRGAILDVQARLDGGPWESLGGVPSGAPAAPFDAELSLTPGDHLVEVRAYDGGAYSLVSRALVRAAPIAPATVRILSPFDGAGVTAGPVEITGTLEGNASGARVQVRAGNATAVHASVLPGGAWRALVPLPPGVHVVEVQAGDGLPRRVTVAAATSPPPALRIASPTDRAAFGSDGDPSCPGSCILFTGAATGAPLRDVLVSLDGAAPVPTSVAGIAAYTRVSPASWTFALPVASLLSGEHRALFTPVGENGAAGAPQGVTFAYRSPIGVRILGDDAPRPTLQVLQFRVEGERVQTATWRLDGHRLGEGLSTFVSLRTPGLHVLEVQTRDHQDRTSTARLPLFALNQPPTVRLDGAVPLLGALLRLDAAGTDVDGRVEEYRWDFGDGTQESTHAPTVEHRFPHPGSFHVTVTAVDDQGATGTASLAARVANADPLAAFSWTPAAPSLLDTVTFHDASVDPEHRLARISWDFGDGRIVEGRTATHRFTSLGEHAVSLTVTDADGGVTRAARLVHVVNLPPTVAFVHEPQTPVTGQEVHFIDRSVDADGRVLSWTWDFGHAAPPCAACDPLQAPKANGSRIVHVFPRPGEYLVNLTVRDDTGAPASAVIPVRVADGAPEVFRIEVEPREPKAQERISFRAVARDPESGPVRLQWEFGDGASSNESQPTHAYARSGLYPLRVVALDRVGQGTNLSLPLYVGNAKPTVQLSFPHGAFAEHETLLQATATDPDGQVVRYRFDADGDGVPECDGPEPRCVFTYPSPGLRLATVAVGDDEGASNLTEVEVDVLPSPRDPRAPRLQVDHPPQNARLSGRVVLAGYAHGERAVAKVEAQLRNATWSLSASREPWMRADGTDAWRLGLDTRAFPDGPYDLVLRATDASGAAGILRVPILVSNGAKDSGIVIEILNAPTAPLRADHELRGVAWHPQGVTSVRYRIDDAPWRDAEGSSVGFFVPLHVKDLGPGVHVLRIDARRGLHDHEEQVMEVRVADAPPTLVVDEPPTPVAYGLLATSGRLHGGEGRVLWRLDHDVWRELPPGKNWSLRFETAGIRGGYHDLHLKAVSLDGVEEGDVTSYRVRVINPPVASQEERRWIEERNAAPRDPNEVDLREVAQNNRVPGFGLAPILAGILVAWATRRSRL